MTAPTDHKQAPRVSDERLSTKHLMPWCGLPDAEASEGLWLARDLRDARARIAELEAENARLRQGYSHDNDEVCQTLGRALGYPKFADDQANFPGATESDGVCVGEHVAASIAAEAAKEIARLRQERDAAWCAGRDASAELVQSIGYLRGDLSISARIRALTPPSEDRQDG